MVQQVLVSPIKVYALKYFKNFTLSGVIHAFHCKNWYH